MLFWETEKYRKQTGKLRSASYKLDNLTAIMDHNGLQIDGANEEVMNVNPVKEKWESFGWHAIEIDGHDFDKLSVL